VAGLADAIRRFFREDRAEAFRAAIVQQRERFSWAGVAQAVLQLAAPRPPSAAPS